MTKHQVRELLLHLLNERNWTLKMISDETRLSVPTINAFFKKNMNPHHATMAQIEKLAKRFGYN